MRSRSSSRATSERMKAVRRRDTTAEMTVRTVAHRLGLRFRLCVSQLPGSPDVVFRRFGICLFVHGCFWHRHRGCRMASIPKTNRTFWVEKFKQNVARDRRKAAALRARGWKVATIWECQTKTPLALERRLRNLFGLSTALAAAPPNSHCRTRLHATLERGSSHP